jgi:hypothetical protein
MKTKTNFRSCALALLAALLALVEVDAAEYTWQLTGGMQRFEIGANFEVDSAAITATRFFQPVDDGLGPAALAAFLSRSSHLSIGADTDKQEFRYTLPSFVRPGDPPPPPPIEIIAVEEAGGYALSGRHVWQGSGWFAGGGVESADTDVATPVLSATDVDRDGYRLVFGKYLGPRTAIEATLRSATTTSHYSSSSICAFIRCILETELVADDLGVSALHVGAVKNLFYSISGGVNVSEANLTFTEISQPTASLPPFSPIAGGGFIAVTPIPNSALPADRFYTYSVGSELFPTRRLGVRVGYVRWDGDEQREDGYDVGATWFFLRNVAARFAFARTNRESFDPDLRESDTATLQIIGRF